MPPTIANMCTNLSISIVHQTDNKYPYDPKSFAHTGRKTKKTISSIPISASTKTTIPFRIRTPTPMLRHANASRSALEPTVNHREKRPNRRLVPPKPAPRKHRKPTHSRAHRLAPLPPQRQPHRRRAGGSHICRSSLRRRQRRRRRNQRTR